MKTVWTLLSLSLLIVACQPAENKPSTGADSFSFVSSTLKPEAADIFKEMEQAIMADSFPNTTSVMLLQNGEITYEGYFGYGDRALLNDTRSATKSLTALAIGIAIDEGKLTVDQPVFELLKDKAPFENETPFKKQITVADFLTMSSALECNDNDMSSPGNEENMYPLRDWTRWAVDIPTRPVYERDENGRGSFAYCTAGSFLLGQVLERATGEIADQFFKRTLFDPLGITTWQWARSPTGEYMTGGGLRLTARDLAKIGLMLENDGVWEGKQVISASWVKAATTPSLTANPQQDYGYQFWQRTWETGCGPVKASYMSGNGGNNVVIMPELDAVIVLTRQHYGQRGMHQQSTRLLENYVLATIDEGC